MRGHNERHKAFGRGLLVFLGATISVVLFAAAAAAQCQLPSDAQKLSACKGNARDVTIGPSAGAQCTKVYVDQSFTGQNGFGKVVIEKGGTLIVPDQTLKIEAARFEVTGVLQAGTATCPIGHAKPTNQITITFTGSRPCATGNCAGNSKGIFVNPDGQLSLYGRKGTAKPEQSWTHLSTPSPAGDSSLDLADDISAGPGAWQDGDWIAVGTTSFNPFETEFVRIQRPTGPKVTLDQHKLQHAHFGGLDPGEPGPANFNAGADRNYGVDERAEVGLISRSIKLTAQLSGDAASRHWGGEIKIVKGFGKVGIQGVEIEKFGKDQLGSYPIHLHEIGPVGAGKLLIDSNSIHHSYNKCITIHSTSSVNITNNVCARIIGHIFYQEVGDEYDVTYTRNLGLGAMSHHFEIYAPTSANDQKRRALIRDHFWAGDNLGQVDSPDYNQYDGLRVPNADKQDNPVHGACFKPDPAPDPFTSNLVLSTDITAKVRQCPAGEYYVEPASGFWIINPGTNLVGNSIGGCQGVGRAFWYVPPGLVIDTQTYNAQKRQELQDLKHRLVGQFKNNRGHACYAGLYAENEFGVASEILNPRVGGVPSGQPVIARFEQFTATRNRKRGVWLRPNWYVLSDARLATNVENVTLVTAGGLDGLAPGVWSLVEDSVVVGHSANNTGRFGPCPYPNGIFDDKPPGLGSKAGGKLGCIEQTPIPSDQIFRGGDVFLGGGGYPDPEQFLIGYMIYDGPVRMFDNRFVNFKVDITPGLTGRDKTFLSDYSKKFRPHDQNFIYEGDAALGWFTSNQSMYPVNTVGKGFSFTNVDLRHQIYTAVVNHGDFRDGDQNTALLDLDGSLSGFVVVDKTGRPAANAYPISLNNLPFNHAFNSVDECLAEGGQNKKFEGRPTALMSPGSLGSVGFEAMFPNENPADRHDQVLVFSKDARDFVGTDLEEHSEMELRGRDGRGIWEPKVTSGYGYTVSAGAGIPKVVMVTPGDVVKPDIGPPNPFPENTFYVRMGICYTSEDKSRNAGHPTSRDQFTVRRGYRSYGGGGIPNFTDPTLNLYWNRLDNRYNNESCFDLNSGNPQNLGAKGCPAHGVTSVPAAGCKAPATTGTDAFGRPACIYPTSTLDVADCIDAGQCDNALTKANGVPDLGKYFYDPSAGMLFFYVAQEFPNALGPAPLGSCKEDGTGDPSCPKFNTHEKETYYPCPAQGCITYAVTLTDSTYVPAPSTCEPYKDDKYTQASPVPQYRLAYKEKVNGVHPVVERSPAGGVDGKDKEFPYYTAAVAPVCKE